MRCEVQGARAPLLGKNLVLSLEAEFFEHSYFLKELIEKDVSFDELYLGRYFILKCLLEVINKAGTPIDKIAGLWYKLQGLNDSYKHAFNQRPHIYERNLEQQYELLSEAQALLDRWSIKDSLEQAVKALYPTGKRIKLDGIHYLKRRLVDLESFYEAKKIMISNIVFELSFACLKMKDLPYRDEVYEVHSVKESYKKDILLLNAVIQSARVGGGYIAFDANIKHISSLIEQKYNEDIFAGKETASMGFLGFVNTVKKIKDKHEN